MERKCGEIKEMGLLAFALAVGIIASDIWVFKEYKSIIMEKKSMPETIRVWLAELVLAAYTIVLLIPCFSEFTEQPWKLLDNTYGNPHWWGTISIVCIIIPTVLCSIPKFFELYKKYKKNYFKIPLLYGIMMLLITGCIYFIINIVFNNYISENRKLFYFTILLFTSLILSFLRYDAKKDDIIRDKLANRIIKINKKIESAISLIESIRISDFGRRQYNKIAKKVNKIIFQKNIYKSFQPVFNEDKQVLNIIRLIDNTSKAELKHQYSKYKVIFQTEHSFKLLQKARRKDDIILYNRSLRDYSELLKRTVENNMEEFKIVIAKAENEYLYKKYSVAFSDDEIEKGFIRNIIVISVILIFLIAVYVLLKKN